MKAIQQKKQMSWPCRSERNKQIPALSRQMLNFIHFACACFFSSAHGINYIRYIPQILQLCKSPLLERTLKGKIGKYWYTEQGCKLGIFFRSTHKGKGSELFKNEMTKSVVFMTSYPRSLPIGKGYLFSLSFFRSQENLPVYWMYMLQVYLHFCWSVLQIYHRSLWRFFAMRHPRKDAETQRKHLSEASDTLPWHPKHLILRQSCQ